MKLDAIFGKTKDLMLSGTILVTMGVLVGSFFSYLLQFFLGRMLTVQDYGTFNALLAVSYLISVPASVFGTSITKISAELYAKNKKNKLTTLFWELVSYAIVAGCSLFIITNIFKHTILEELHLNSMILVTYFGVYLGASYLNVVPSAYLQGLLKFRDLAIFSALSGFLRFLFPVILILLGFNLVGVFAGIFISIAVVFYVAVQLLNKDFGTLVNVDLSSSYKKIINFSAPVLFVSSGLMLLNNLDILLVKKFFDEVLVGYYAGVVTLGKILLFGTGTIATVMFPKISALYTRKEDYKKVFFEFLCLQVGVVLVGVLAFVIFPEFFTLAFFGSRFIHSIIYLPRFSIFIGIYVIINFLVMYCLAIEKIRVFLFFIPAVISQYFLICRFHSTLKEVVNINIAITAVLLVLILFYVFSTNLVQKR